jgi:hypothetical protein
VGPQRQRRQTPFSFSSGNAVTTEWQVKSRKRGGELEVDLKMIGLQF